MKVLVNYFSQTNNTKSIAEEMAAAFLQHGHECVSKAFTEITSDDIRQADILGCGTPVHAWRIPDNYHLFLDNLPYLQGKNAFVFVTYGDVITANVLYEMAMLLRRKAAVILGGFKSVGRHNMPPLRRRGKGAGHPDEHELQQARLFVEKISEKANGHPVDMSEKLYIHRPLVALMAPMMTRRNLNQAMPKIGVIKARCNQCGICVDICPESNIQLNPYPEFIGDCLKCYQCTESCPQSALNVNWRLAKLFAPLLDIPKEKGDNIVL